MGDPKPVERPLSENGIGKLDANNDFGLMSMEDLAAALGKDWKTIKNWVGRREIPFVRIGSQTMFFKDSVREWLRKKETKPHGSN